MKTKYCILITLASAALAQAEDSKWSYFDGMDWDKNGSVSQKEWTNWHKQNAEKKGWTFNEENAIAKYKQKDANGNGNLSRDEVEGEAQQ